MKRNTKGFTLVELLAAMVILGILMLICVPTILNMLENNRNRVYVDDAKKMIAQAEYRIRANNSTIEKPSEGSAIVISLGYLESSDFDNPPNNGEYLKEASYVVVKNDGRKLEYSASIVEKMKQGGYKGVTLTKNADLLKNNATKYVKVFSKKDLYYVETAPTGKSLSSGEINKLLGNDYCGEIEAVYNDIELSDDVVQKADNPPKIKSLTIASASNRDFNSFDALLTLKAEDDNTLKKDLKVYISVVSYEDALKEVNGETYGSGKDYYTKNINFSDAKYGGYKEYDGSKITVYVVVKDNVGNVTKKIQEYYLHNNAAPIIDMKETKLFKRTSDEFAMPKATLKLVVSDDDDEREEILICLKPSKEKCSAREFKKYKDYFDSGTTMTYDFGGIPDGRNVQLHIEAKDKENMITETDLDYKIYNNEPPKIKGISITSSNNDLPASIRGDKGDLTINFTVNASDDFGDSNISFSVQDVTSNKAAAEFKYANCSSGTCSYKLGGNYDGGGREVKFVFKDQYGATASKSEVYTVYDNNPPTVSASISTQRDACTNTSFCRGSNSLDTYVRITATDDVDYINNYANLKVCLSQNENDCKNPSSGNYKSYSEYINKATSFRLSNGDTPYNGDTKKVYVYVADTYGAITKKVLDYKLYQNQKPANVTLNVATVVDEHFSYHSFNDSDYGPFNLKDVLVNFSADDDFGTDHLQLNICYRKTTDGNETCLGYKSYSSYSSPYRLSLPETKYSGQQYVIILKVKDTYGQDTTKNVNYTLFKDLAPKIDNFEVSSTNNDYHNSTIHYTYRVRDAFDTYSVCINGRKNNTTPVTYAECARNPYYIKDNVSGNNTNSVSGQIDLRNFDWSYDRGTSKNIYLVVKDSNNHEKVIGEDYAMYKYCTNLSDGYESKYELAQGEEEITAERCGGRCYQDIVDPSDPSNPNNINLDIMAMYNETLTYKDKHFSSHNCIKEKQISRNCEYHTCYRKSEGEYYIAVGTRSVTADWSHEHEDGEMYSHSFYYRMYQVTYDANRDFLKFTGLPTKICIDELDNYNLENGYVYTTNYDEEGA